VTTFPAFCTSCGLIFESRAFGFGGGAHNITLTGVRETCPRCGSLADLPDGTFNVFGDTIHVLASPELTRQRLERLKEIVDAAQRGTLRGAEVTDAVAEAVPEAARWFAQMQALMGRAFLPFLFVVLQLLAAQLIAEARDDSATREDVERAIAGAVDRCIQSPP